MEERRTISIGKRERSGMRGTEVKDKAGAHSRMSCRNRRHKASNFTCSGTSRYRCCSPAGTRPAPPTVTLTGSCIQPCNIAPPCGFPHRLLRLLRFLSSPMHLITSSWTDANASFPSSHAKDAHAPPPPMIAAVQQEGGEGHSGRRAHKHAGVLQHGFNFTP